MWQTVKNFLLQYSLKDYIEAIIAILVGCSALYSARISKKVEEGITKITDIQYYNKSRKKLAGNLKECERFFSDKDIKIDLTVISKTQKAIQDLRVYSIIFNKKEQKKLNQVLKLINENESNYANAERTQILEIINAFIAKLEKGDILL
ncbi:hypothetical protein [Candidatus Formimonas warabiya]|uniref:Uncharacterized protein n=1 Tax=Formimonas warabiya TaxID=1761012 RepID=A0A3G1KPV3_FORW1|nr:hypothetical protein [Candidatus Formimonas warabiya]ATW24175.1 hypothetical protein DCMF_04695 [Candidatus Formimonas warabiya]